MKARLFKILHFFKLDVLLLRVLERLSAGLTKKHQALKAKIDCFLCCRLSATADAENAKNSPSDTQNR